MTKYKSTLHGTNVYNPKTAHCYRITSKSVGTRGRVTMKDIYGNTHRGPVSGLVQMTPFEAAVVAEGERTVRRKHTMSEMDRTLASCYTAFVNTIKRALA